MNDFNKIIEEMLLYVRDHWPQTDVREGGIIYRTLAPTALLLERQQFYADNALNSMMPDTARGEDLDRCLRDFGLARESATKALREGRFTDSNGSPAELFIGTRFGAEGIVYIVKERIEAGSYKLECNQPGTIGNLYSGALLPVDNVNGLGEAVLLPMALIPARDKEADDELRARFYNSARLVRYGCNIADYTDMALSIEGVGAVAVFNATVMGKGKVGLVIGDAQGNTATAELVARVQKAMGTDGDGLAAIGHTVEVATSQNFAVSVVVAVQVREGSSLALVSPVIEQTVRAYIENVAFSDDTIFKAKLEAGILGCDPRIEDISPIILNGQPQNLHLSKTFSGYQVPVCGTVTITGVA